MALTVEIHEVNPPTAPDGFPNPVAVGVVTFNMSTQGWDWVPSLSATYELLQSKLRAFGRFIGTVPGRPVTASPLIESRQRAGFNQHIKTWALYDRSGTWDLSTGHRPFEPDDGVTVKTHLTNVNGGGNHAFLRNLDASSSMMPPAVGNGYLTVPNSPTALLRWFEWRLIDI